MFRQSIGSFYIMFCCCCSSQLLKFFTTNPICKILSYKITFYIISLTQNDKWAG